MRARLPALRDKLPHLVALAIAVGIMIALPFLRIDWKALEGYGYLGIFLVNVVGSASLFFPIPGLAVAFVEGGLSFSPILIGLAGAAGSSVGELTGYMAGYGGQAVLEGSERYARIEHWMKRHGDITIFVLAAIPNPLFDMAGVAAGSLHFPLWRFGLACFAGKLVKFMAVALLGSLSLARLLPQ